MKPSLRTKLDSLARRLEELNRLLSAENAARDMGEFRKLSREHAELSNIAGLYASYQQAERDAADASEMAGDPSMKGFADEELKAAQAAMLKLEADVQAALLPRDPNDDRNIFLEVRAGTGGDEAALFAGELFRMYDKYSERQQWRGAMARIHPISKVTLDQGFLEMFRDAAVDRIALALDPKGFREIQRVDANGAEAQRTAMAMRKGVLQRLVAPRQIGAALAEQGANQFLSGMQSPPPGA